jgi:dienelactone hydrolase
MPIWVFTFDADCAPAVVFETLRLSNGPPATLCLVQMPSENATRHPVILTLGSLKPDELPDWSANLLHEGFMVVAFAVEYPPDPNPARRPEWLHFDSRFAHSHVIGGIRTPNDTSRVIDYLASRPDVDAQRIGWLGSSTTGILGLAAATRERRIKAIVAFVATGAYEKWLGAWKPNGLWQSDEAELWPETLALLPEADPIRRATNLFPCATLLVNGGADKVVDIASTRAFVEAARPAYRNDPDRLRLVVYDGMGHNLPRDVVRLYAEHWFRLYLTPSAVPSSATIRPTTLSESTRRTALTPTPHENLIGAAQPNHESVKAAVPLRAGVARVSINPMEEKIPVQLGGYGAREGKPAEGTLDTMYGKVILFETGGEKSALITVDMCTVPICVAEETLRKAAIKGLTLNRMLISASHTHAGLEGYSLDRRNVANNPNIGIFSEPALNFVTDRLAKALREADAVLQPVRAASGAVNLPGMSRNRRGSKFIDPQMTVLRLDKADGSPYAVLVNYTAHGTFVNEHDMLISGEWAGNMQRTVEDLIGGGVICLFTNAAEGDISPEGRSGGSNYEQAWNYGRQVGIAAWRLAKDLRAESISRFASASEWVILPTRLGAPDFVKIAGAEYHVTQQQLDQLVMVLLPEKAPILRASGQPVRNGDVPGRAYLRVGTWLKEALRKAGIAHPCVAALTTDEIGYILTKEEYQKSGYEVTASFYGEGLGQLLLDHAKALGLATAAKE